MSMRAAEPSRSCRRRHITSFSHAALRGLRHAGYAVKPLRHLAAMRWHVYAADTHEYTRSHCHTRLSDMVTLYADVSSPMAR